MGGSSAQQATNIFPSDFGVNVVGFVSARFGLGLSARWTIGALVGAGVPVAVADIALPDGRSGYDNTWMHLHVRSSERLPYPVTLVHINPLEAAGLWRQYPQWFETGVSCIVPFWELPDVPESWIPELSRYDAILAPTEHIAAAMRNRVAVPVRSFPNCVDASNVGHVSRAEFGIPEDKVAFYTTWDTDSGLNRKNGLGVLRAFGFALELGADAVLVVKQNGNSRHPELTKAIAGMPEGSVIVVDDYLDYPRVLGLHNACDVFVSLHRAEGLGNGAMEAMLLGKPVITTGWSGNLNFMDDSCASLVRYTLTPVVDTQPAYAPGNFSRPQLWAEPDLLDAAQRIYTATVDDHYRSILGKVGQARALDYVAEWKSLAPKRLLEIYGNAVG